VVTSPTQADQDLLALAGDFAEPGNDAWMAVVEKSLGGRPYEKLTKKSYDGIALKPLYTKANDGRVSVAMSGPTPLTGGRSAPGSTGTGWDVRCLSSHPDPAEANRQILLDLEKGATSIWLKLDPTGRSGTIIKSRADMDALLDGVLLDLAPVVLDPGGPSLPPAAYVMDILSRRSVAPDAFIGNFGADPLSTLAAVGKVIVPMDTLLGRMADLAAHVSTTYVSAKALNVSTVAYHNAGCSEAQELGIALATAVEYLRRMTEAGLTVDNACRQMAFTLTCDADIFLSVAKLRVVRRLWTRVAEASGASETNQTAPIYAVTAPRMFSQRDPWVNILRGTAACFAGAVGGADSVTVLPLESAIGLPTKFGRRIARNTQIVLQEESALSRVADPASGSWMVESLTHELAETAWGIFQNIEAGGGLAASLENGSVADMVAATEIERARNIATRKDPITGVSEFPNIAEKPVDVEEPDAATLVSAAEERAAKANGTARSLPGHGDGALMTALVEAAHDDASTATIGAALRGSPLEIKPLPQHRLAEHFESLRDASDRWTETYGQRSRVFLANIGAIADFTARATFARNLFEAGGFDVISGAGGNTVADIVGDFKESGTPVVVICSTDTIYSDIAQDLAKALKKSDATLVYVATRPGETEAGLREAGIDGFIFRGTDVLNILTDAQECLGVSQ